MPRDALTKVDQTILAGDPQRAGNCFAACVATALGKPIEAIPHFIEWGQHLHSGKPVDDDDPDRSHWWGIFLGFTFALNLMPHEFATVDDVPKGQIAFVAGMSPRGVLHQVLYLDGALWHDPHPTHAGLIDIREVFAVLPMPASGHDHEPTPGHQTRPEAA